MDDTSYSNTGSKDGTQTGTASSTAGGTTSLRKTVGFAENLTETRVFKAEPAYSGIQPAHASTKAEAEETAERERIEKEHANNPMPTMPSDFGSSNAVNKAYWDARRKWNERKDEINGHH